MMPTPDTPAQILTAARKAIDAGREAECRDTLEAFLRDHPGAAEGWLLLARAQAGLDRPDAARAAFARCSALAAREPVLWMERALFEASQGQGGQVVKEARKAGLPQTLVTMVQGAASGQGTRAQTVGGATKGDLAKLSKAVEGRNGRAAEAIALPLLKARAGGVVWGLLAQARYDAGNLPAAAEAFRQGLRLEPYAIDLRMGLTRALSDHGDLIAALVAARSAARCAPLLPAAQIVFGRILLQSGLPDRAMEIAEATLIRAPGNDPALALAAEAAMQVARPADAVTFARARAAKARDRDVLIARALGAANQVEEAISTYGTLIAANPNDSEALAARGQLRQSLGEDAAAEADLRAAIAANPGNGTAHRALAYGTRLAADDPILNVMQAQLAGSGLTAFDRRMIDYALARALQPTDPEAAFRHLDAANASMLHSYPYDPRQLRELFDRNTAQEWPRIRDAKAQSACTAAPIFVTGLPRSGTTLVETILATHPDVVMGGELGVLRRNARDLHRAVAEGEAVTDALLTAAGDAYAAAAEAAATTPGEGRRRTDKSIFSFLEIGLIRTILPKATIIAVQRDPRDTGLSIWRNHFREGTHRYAASQTGIADTVELYRDALDFWDGALPGAVHRIRYEDLLADPEGEARRLLAVCGLNWTPEVLSFHEHAARVDTLSFAQVRQPLYTSSKGGWQKVEAHIQPMIAALAKKGLLPD
ncbi:sulfotransferase [Jannaschia pohangensis]|uniref:Tetratricopeptide repeat-containing protein n=1 Tax=Jannaschia pohangensis TaxID=390807 RepID=A0A1I3JTR8_9RHOB|nr:sulfotransferase [Jannaschia pohangensis]SFI63490.1 Tetratricopeptide repeat-containing protein [Jannaschia pohangensis]